VCIQKQLTVDFRNQQEHPRYRWAVLAAATLAQITASFVLQGLGVLAGFLQAEFNLSGMQVGLLTSASGLGPCFALLLIGDLLDRKSERAIIAGGAIAIASALFCGALTTSFGTMLACLFLVGVGYSTVQPGGSKSISTWFPGNQRGLAMGIRQAGLPIGGALGSAILPAITIALGWRTAFGLGAVTVLCGGIVFAWVNRRPETGEGAKYSTRPPANRGYIMELFRQKPLRRAVWSGLSMIIVQYAILVHFMLMLRDIHHIPLVEGAWFLFIAQIAGGIGRVALAFWGDHCRKGRFHPVFASLVSCVAGLAVLILMPTDTPAAVFAAIAAWVGFFGFGWFGPWIAYLTEAAPSESVGLVLGVAMTLNQVAIVTATPFLGLLHDLSGSYVPSWVCLVSLLLIAVSLTRQTAPSTDVP
jgi:MFS family permease